MLHHQRTGLPHRGVLLGGVSAVSFVPSLTMTEMNKMYFPRVASP